MQYAFCDLRHNIRSENGRREAGCYRLGETGYHWYRSCFGPRRIYPRHRVCRHGYCWYR